nr:MAG TPA: chromosome partition protein [Bacteriophage sp.]
MKNIIIKRMHLLNFKAFKDFSIEFNEHITTIQGRNGSGKTTIFDAFTWLLFGKNSDDRKDFGIKTKDADGNVIENVPHEVSAVLLVNGEEITLCRRLVEKWQKKRGSAVAEFTGNTEERLFNDVPCSVKEWSEKIDNICTEQVFKFITNPLYFNQQKTDVQRAMLFRMAGNISDDEIAADSEDFRALLDKLTGKTLDEYKKEIAAKKKRIKAETDTIPDRIDERKRDMPEASDWDAINASIAEKKQQKEEYEAQIADASQAYSAANDERMQKVKMLSDLKQQRATLENDIKNKVQAGYHKALQEKREVDYKISDLSQEINRKKEQLARDRKNLESWAAYREKLIAEWKEINAETLQFNEDEFRCPTCHRPFEPDEIEAKQQEMTQRFNARKANELAENSKVGKANTERMHELEASIKETEAAIAAKTEELENMRYHAACNVNPICPDATPTIEADAAWLQLSKQIAEIEAETQKPIEMANNADLKERCKQIDNEIYALNAILANKGIIERNNARIAELEKQLRTQSEELAELEGIEFTIAEFTKARIEAVDKRINGMFSLVKFKMYEKQINGGEVETCIATVDGIPYSDLNDAKKVNAGLDIINAICKFEGITAPIFCDNAESVNKLLDTASQQIRLVVTFDENLIIKNNVQRDLFN